jgi:hypothetical protein
MNHLSSANRQPDTVDSSSVNPRHRALRSVAAHPSVSSRWRGRVTVTLIVWISFGLAGVHLTAAQNVPSGTIELKGGSVAAGVGYTWGKGILVFDGQEYPVKVSGLSIVQVGVSSYTASGTVYDLTKVSDINGIYTAVSAGAAVGGGASATAMKNDKGVLIQMVSTHQGVNFSLSAKGLEITLGR